MQITSKYASITNAQMFWGVFFNQLCKLTYISAKFAAVLGEGCLSVLFVAAWLCLSVVRFENLMWIVLSEFTYLLSSFVFVS